MREAVANFKDKESNLFRATGYIVSDANSELKYLDER